MQTYHQVTTALSVDEAMRRARQTIDDCVGRNPGGPWSAPEEQAARRVCAAFNIAAVLAEQHALPRSLLLAEYSEVITKLATDLAHLRPRWGARTYRAFWSLAEAAASESEAQQAVAADGL